MVELYYCYLSNFTGQDWLKSDLIEHQDDSHITNFIVIGAAFIFKGGSSENES